MAFKFKVSTAEDNVKDFTGGGSNYITTSGIYEIIIKNIIVEASPKGSEYLNFWINYNGQDQPLYQAIRITNNDGNPNLEAKLFNKLCVIAGATDGDDVSGTTTKQLPMGEKGAMKEVEVLEAFEDVPVLVRIQLEYGMYNDKITTKKIIRNFFRVTDKATAAEIINNDPKDTESFGKQYAIEEEYADVISYKDNVTAEDVAEWKKNKSSSKGEEKGEQPTKPSGGFGAKRFGSKSE
jgi:hypothetical protein